jgi:hypothetical protein
MSRSFFSSGRSSGSQDTCGQLESVKAQNQEVGNQPAALSRAGLGSTADAVTGDNVSSAKAEAVDFRR